MFRKTIILCTVALATVLTSCSSDTADKKSPDARLAAEKACGGLSPKAASSLEGITETKEFKHISHSSVPGILKRGISTSPGEEGEARYLSCEIQPQQPTGKNAVRKISVFFETIDRLPPDESEAVGVTTLPIGLRAIGDDGTADIFFDCKSPDSATGENDGSLIHAELVYGATPRKADPRKRNLEILQALTFKMAQNLGCADNGGIPRV
ncbi:hypothetical protein [Streptomyces purpurogeneiscleroticus]|uniref:hypothetical protein n=1 Tax=Streptomyces purpurogeneiscleroticus TaxID=68259 RepID=UPI001CBF1F4E|nr:hypothetical protein [Streptomyces purpurogeneiscleroticus]